MTAPASSLPLPPVGALISIPYTSRPGYRRTARVVAHCIKAGQPSIRVEVWAPKLGGWTGARAVHPLDLPRIRWRSN